MICCELEIINKLGLHARATAKLVKLLQGYESKTSLKFNELSANGKSIMSVMMLAAAQGSIITFYVDGVDEQSCMQDITKLIMNRFGEDE
ncbi:MAG: HPr family phosphocarrier protein [Gammaproteobacteria bacterium]|nr:HPr family phosphocarrier protein [Gammaproteobacteria bacterium]